MDNQLRLGSNITSTGDLYIATNVSAYFSAFISFAVLLFFLTIHFNNRSSSLTLLIQNKTPWLTECENSLLVITPALPSMYF